MSLARAFTTRRARKVSDLSSASSSTPDLPQRSLTTKRSMHGSIRNKISAPIELISTTNMLSYNAPDIYPSSSTSSSSSTSGDDVFDKSTSLPSSPLSSPDSSSIESSSPKPNHLSSYFGSPSPSDSTIDAPVIPKRAPSHTKKLSESLARKRSVSSNISSRQASISSRQASVSTSRSSVNMFSAQPDPMEHHNTHHISPYGSNPFGLELAKVSELAEEYGAGRDDVAIVDPEEQDLISRGLFKFCAEEYMNEIHSCFLDAFGDRRMAPISSSAMWI